MTVSLIISLSSQRYFLVSLPYFSGIKKIRQIKTKEKNHKHEFMNRSLKLYWGSPFCRNSLRNLSIMPLLKTIAMTKELTPFCRDAIYFFRYIFNTDKKIYNINFLQVFFFWQWIKKMPKIVLNVLSCWDSIVMLAQTLHNVLQTTSCNIFLKIVVYLEIVFDKLYEPKETLLLQTGSPVSEPKKTRRNLDLYKKNPIFFLDKKVNK